MIDCPHCGADLAPDARSCKECGSDADTGWARHADSVGLLPPEYVPQRDQPRSRPFRAVAIVTLVAFTAVFLFFGYPIFAVLTGVAALLIAAWPRIRKLTTNPEREGMARLVRLTRGDVELAKRLIEHEFRRAPELSRADAMRRAATRLEHDRR